MKQEDVIEKLFHFLDCIFYQRRKNIEFNMYQKEGKQTKSGVNIKICDIIIM